MAERNSLYLVSGEGAAKIDAWRARVRKRAEAEGGPGALELFEGKEGGPAALAAALATLSFSDGTRYLLADGVEGWKETELELIEPELAAMPPDTVLVLIARGKIPPRVAKAVEKGGGETVSYDAPKPWELPGWARERAQEEGLRLDGEAAKVLVGTVGTSQARIAREIEKLALAKHPDTNVSVQDIEEFASGDAGPDVWALADALVAGRVDAALQVAERLGEERPTALSFRLVRELRNAHRAAAMLDAGVADAQIAKEMGMPPWKAKKTIAKARKADRDGLERALCAFADFEVETRGGGQLDEETAFTRTLVRAAG
ncbi:MAG: DNA polymerase III subunit delta [Thermoleophilaceae bacterium]|nr:DNA polymerase III subunit delta [Thermoleophilaceae bacterium]